MDRNKHFLDSDADIYVVPRTGYVDRNVPGAAGHDGDERVVPRTGYVDRNAHGSEWTPKASVVPRTGYVDRNEELAKAYPGIETSYPARGTWIEIAMTYEEPRED